MDQQTMKSIVEEASSIIKAIEKAWSRAGSPQEFSIKVFEDAQKGFFGMTTKNAKVGIFFKEHDKPTQKASASREKVAEKKVQAPQRQQQRKSKKEPSSELVDLKKPLLQDAQPYNSEQTQTKERKSPWTDDMSRSVEQWLKDLLVKSQLPSISFSTKRSGNRLHIMFEKPFFETEEQNSSLFRSLSYLLLGMLKSKCKKEFRFLKIVLTAN